MKPRTKRFIFSIDERRSKLLERIARVDGVSRAVVVNAALDLFDVARKTALVVKGRRKLREADYADAKK